MNPSKTVCNLSERGDDVCTRLLYSCTEKVWTFTTNIRLDTFLTTYLYLKTATLDQFLSTNVTGKPSAFIVWLQQMSFQSVIWFKTFWTVFTSMPLHQCEYEDNISDKSFYETVTHSKGSHKVLCRCPHNAHVAASAQTFVTQGTLVWPTLVMAYVTTNRLERFGRLQRHSFNDHSLSLPLRLALLLSLLPSGTLFLLTLDLQSVSHLLNVDWNPSFFATAYAN